MIRSRALRQHDTPVRRYGLRLVRLRLACRL